MIIILKKLFADLIISQQNSNYMFPDENLVLCPEEF